MRCNGSYIIDLGETDFIRLLCVIAYLKEVSGRITHPGIEECLATNSLVACTAFCISEFRKYL